MKETVRSRVKQTSLSLVQNKIIAIRRKDIQRTGCRLIADGKISITGGLGKVDEDELFAKAATFLTEAVEYPVEPTTGVKSNTDLRSLNLSDTDLCNKIEFILNSLKESCPSFFISNKVNMNSIEYSIENDGGLDMKFADTYLSVSFLLKEATSTGIMDTFFGITDRKLEESRIIQTVKEIIGAYQN
ncbi:MAG: hypothetical protein AB1403_08820, partial [Candidatus Riflebacteria bacterium]